MKNTEQVINLCRIIPNHLGGQRLDQALAALFPEFSRTKLQSWIVEQHIKVDGQSKRPRDRVQGGESVTITATLKDETTWEGQAIDLNVIYEDDELLVINKPAGLVVHPAPGNPDSTLVNALLYRLPHNAKLPRAGIIHRLDKNTSGLLVVAKTLPSYTECVRQLQERTIQREYRAVVNGILIAGGTIDAPMGRHPKQRKHMAVVEEGKPAITHYRILERFRAHTLLKVNLETGRTHQIRVHMAHIGHPLVGDPTYGRRLQIPKNASPELTQTLREFNRQALHARRLALIHPVSRQEVEWLAPLPEDMQHLIEILREDCAAPNTLTRTFGPPSPTSGRGKIEN